MKKILYILLVGLLVLAACDDNGDEPKKGKSPRILLEIYTGSFGGYYIYDNNGKLVYECPKSYGITNMAAEGKNWYGVLLSNSDSIYRVLKNGKLAYSTPFEIKSLCVENGNIYTLQWDKAPDYKYTGDYITRIFKNETQIYEYDSNIGSIGDLRVDHGDLYACAWLKERNWKPTYWMNGKFYNLPSYEEYLSTRHIVKQGNDTLVLLQNGLSGGGTYPNYCWINGEAHQILNNLDLSYVRVMLVGGVPYIATHRYNSFVLIVNGQEYTTETSSTNRVVKMQRYGNNVYTLTSNNGLLPPDGNTRIFKGLEPVEIDGKICVKDMHLRTGRDNDTVSLAEFTTHDFVVLDK